MDAAWPEPVSPEFARIQEAARSLKRDVEREGAELSEWERGLILRRLVHARVGEGVTRKASPGEEELAAVASYDLEVLVLLMLEDAQA